MAEGESRPKRREPDEGGSFDGKERLSEITGLDAESVTSLERVDDGTWKVTVELLELSRVPETDDMLGSYEVELDETGELLGYRRLRRYTRVHGGVGSGK